MSALISRLEPLFWILFGAGAFMAAMLLPALFLVLAIGFPLGWFGAPLETFERMRFLVANPAGKLVLALLFSLIFWHSAHHLRHFAFDLGLHRMANAVSLTVYGLAALGTLLAFGVVGGL
jgi:fumarate reductase subunit D